MQLLDSSIAILDTGVGDYPRLAKVLQTTRHFELVSSHDLTTAQATLLSEIQPEVTALLSRVETHLDKLERREKSLIAKAELQEGRLSRTSAGRTSSSGARRSAGERSSTANGSVAATTTTTGLSALEEMKLQQLRQKKDRLGSAVSRLELQAGQRERQLRKIQPKTAMLVTTIPRTLANRLRTPDGTQQHSSMLLADLEWLAALAYPVGILISTLLAKKKPIPTVAPATISELQEQILANARVLYPASSQPNIPDLAIAIFSHETQTDQAADKSRTSSSKKTSSPLRAVILLVRLEAEDDETASDADSAGATATTRTLVQGSPGKNLGEALEGLLAVTAAALEERVGDGQQRGRARKRE
ncbi:DASH complex subunit spc19 [Friedmanniomyces endolithicus]|uniref:DASH complex subunit SPC19 n=1 Tax=Friedmanniomyces endolithicus TaxID=329885 RepID=A0AAN6K3D7_9PEZI|nr:DASH complex subunit spc19 [Friedmanniomyces endolithicus]